MVPGGNGDGVCWSWGERGGGVPIPGKKRDGVPRSLFRGKVGDAEPRSQGKRGMRCPGPGEKGDAVPRSLRERGMRCPSPWEKG